MTHYVTNNVAKPSAHLYREYIVLHQHLHTTVWCALAAETTKDWNARLIVVFTPTLVSERVVGTEKLLLDVLLLLRRVGQAG